MIHVFNCAKEVCSLPGQACIACGNCASQINCDCCTECGKSFSNFMDKPLSTYVVIKVLLALTMLYYSYAAFSDPASQKCELSKDASVGLSTWLQVQMAFAGMHIIFAPYFQYQVWLKMMEKLQDPQSSAAMRFTRAGQAAGSVLGAGSATGSNYVPGIVIHESFKEVLLYDIGILFYVAVLLASFIWSYLGATWFAGGHDHAHCNAGGNTGSSAYFGMCFFWAALLYNGCYYYCGCCAGSVQLRDPPPELEFSRVPGIVTDAR
mmetsp:Transcript_4419/g.7049  ORF Transcript_4419/g.7049 Transcript_4419/m.7049 type:complete len:264 (-) Transcript_4419:214-1005(-)